MGQHDACIMPEAQVGRGWTASQHRDPPVVGVSDGGCPILPTVWPFARDVRRSEVVSSQREVPPNWVATRILIHCCSPELLQTTVLRILIDQNVLHCNATSGVRCRIICNELAHEAQHAAGAQRAVERRPKPPNRKGNVAGWCASPSSSVILSNSALAVLQVPSSCAWHFSATKWAAMCALSDSRVGWSCPDAAGFRDPQHGFLENPHCWPTEQSRNVDGPRALVATKCAHRPRGEDCTTRTNRQQLVHDFGPPFRHTATRPCTSRSSRINDPSGAPVKPSSENSAYKSSRRALGVSV